MRAKLKPGRANLRPGRANLRPGRTNLRPRRAKFEALMLNRGGMDARKDGRTDISKFLPVFFRTSALWGRSPKKAFPCLT